MAKRKNEDVATALGTLLGSDIDFVQRGDQQHGGASEPKPAPFHPQDSGAVRIGSMVDAALWRRVKIECASSGISIRSLLERALRAELDRPAEKNQ